MTKGIEDGNLDEMCNCGHTAEYHSGGYGDCMTGSGCDCRGFDSEPVKGIEDGMGDMGPAETLEYLRNISHDDLDDAYLGPCQICGGKEIYDRSMPRGSRWIVCTNLANHPEEHPGLVAEESCNHHAPGKPDCPYCHPVQPPANPLSPQEGIESVPRDIAHTLWYRGSRLHHELKDSLDLHPEIWHADALKQMLGQWDEIATRYASEVIIASPKVVDSKEEQEHPRADCEGCNKPDCPCNAREYEGKEAIAYSDGFISGREAGYLFTCACLFVAHCGGQIDN